MSDKVCSICKKSAVQSCSACSCAYYCSKDHQKEDWKHHKNICAPFKVQKNEILGRHLVATRPIKQGEILVKKNPLVLGPKTASYPLCLGCHKQLSAKAEYLCSTCKWPMCGKKCEKLPHHQPECSIFAKNKYKPKVVFDQTKQSVYSCIVPLRILTLKEKQPKSFEAFMTCQSHYEAQKDAPLYRILKSNLSPLFSDILGINTSEDEIMNICSILDTNTFDIRDKENLINIRGFYPTVSLMAHDCRHNTRHVFSDGFQFILIATMPIKKGERITTTYTQTLWNTLSRRQHLQQTKHFFCRCPRCLDPTEFGTYAGSVFCSRCKDEMLTDDGPKVISTDTDDVGAPWKCERCDNLIPARQMMSGYETLRKEIMSLDKTHPKALEHFLFKYGEILPKSNSFCLEVKYGLAQMYGNIKGFELKDLPVELLERKMDLCKELLEVADRLEPGFSRFRGCLLYDLQAAMVMHTKKQFCADKIDKKQAEDILSKSLDILHEASKILIQEPDYRDDLKKRIENFSKGLDL